MCFSDKVLSLFQQPTARVPANNYSHRRMEDRPHMNGGLRQENSIPMHLTNGYADNNNTMANVSVTKTLLHGMAWGI